MKRNIKNITATFLLMSYISIWVINVAYSGDDLDRDRSSQSVQTTSTQGEITDLVTWSRLRDSSTGTDSMEPVSVERLRALGDREDFPSFIARTIKEHDNSLQSLSELVMHNFSECCNVAWVIIFLADLIREPKGIPVDAKILRGKQNMTPVAGVPKFLQSMFFEKIGHALSYGFRTVDIRHTRDHVLTFNLCSACIRSIARNRRYRKQGKSNNSLVYAPRC